MATENGDNAMQEAAQSELEMDAINNEFKTQEPIDNPAVDCEEKKLADETQIPVLTDEPDTVNISEEQKTDVPVVAMEEDKDDESEQQEESMDANETQTPAKGKNMDDFISSIFPEEQTKEEEKDDIGDVIVLDVADNDEAEMNSEEADGGTAEVEDNKAESLENGKQDEEEKENIDDGLERMPKTPEDYSASFDDDSMDVSIDPELDEGENPAMPSDGFKKYWKTVKESPQDFTAWTYLLQLVEQENLASLARRAYNEFFKRYPLCYGYWKKFSEFERRNNHPLRAQKVLERGVRAIPLSVDLWVHVIDFYMKNYKGSDAGVEYTRKVMKRALNICGEEFRSEKLWNKVLRWEVENKAWRQVMDIYNLVLRTQTQHYSVFYSDLKDFINAHLPQEVIPFQDYEDKLEKVRETVKAKAKERKQETVPDEMAPPGVEDGDSSMPPTEKELKQVRQLIIAEKKKIHEENQQLITKIWNFEEGIKRPYFHVKALERTQIKNWREYLDSEIARGESNNRRVVLLFERCLIACALYEDFWMKYARFLSKTDIKAARTIYKRACDIHLPKKPNIHLHWATFEEANGFPEAAMEVLNVIDDRVPGLAMIRMRKIAVLRRSNNVEKAEELLRAFLSGCTLDSDIIFYTRKLAWFVAKVNKKSEQAIEIYKELLKKYKNKSSVYKDLLELYYIYGTESDVLDVCDKACSNTNLSDEDKYFFSQRRLSFLDDFACDAKRLQRAYEEHQKWTRIQRKRSQTDIVAVEPAAKKSKGDRDSKGSRISTTGSRHSSGSNISVSATSYTKSPSQTTQVAANTVYGQPTQYPAPAAAAGDPAAQYYQNYWQQYQQHQKTGDPATAQYNYNQWAQYYQQQSQ